MGPRQVVVLLTPLLLGGFAQAVVIRYDLLPQLAVPIDGGIHFRGRPLFGTSKTWRGALVMVAAGIFTATILFTAYPPLDPVTDIGWPGLGAGMALGYIVAELPNSFVKRRLGIRAGSRAHHWAALQYVVDQVDSVIGVAIALRLLTDLTWAALASLAVVGTLVHVAFDVTLHVLGIKQRQEATT